MLNCSCKKCNIKITNIEDVNLIIANRNFFVDTVCKGCFEKEYPTCVVCKKNDNIELMRDYTGGKKVCLNCIRGHSQNQTRRVYICNFGNVYLCKEDAGLVLNGTYVSTEGMHLVKFCNNCKNIINNITYKCFGNSCAQCKDRVVKSYRYNQVMPFKDIDLSKKRPNIVSLNKNKRFFGIELEVQYKLDNPESKSYYDICVDLQKTLRGFAYLKHDGTTGDHQTGAGFEIVSAPATKEVHYLQWAKLFKKYKENVYLKGQTCITGTLDDGTRRKIDCGIHIHVNKNSLTPLQLGKAYSFMNNENNTKFIEYIAQRNISEYAKVENSRTVLDCFGGSWVGNENRNGKMNALNLANQHTVEFRIFKSTLDESLFFKNLEFVDALLDFCVSGENSITNSMELSYFLKYVEKYSGLYPNLYDYLVKGNYCAVKINPMPKNNKKNKNNKNNKKSKDKKRPFIKVNLRDIKTSAPNRNTTKLRYFGSNNARKEYLSLFNNNNRKEPASQYSIPFRPIMRRLVAELE